ncbi:hypothetical protein H2204_001914 [Knufia peltigerae]|uniref:Uncharacterized protein n=1 Tax=Knufia peltigerae TaxID=1002370 RepID=A0AA38YC77_9EURO|nr:hypothetical protein H2204_001914 [Knufia peltigerae]
MDAHGSFVYLVENIPVWKTSAESIATRASRKHAEFAAEFARLVHQTKPQRKKTASVASIRTAEEEDTNEELSLPPQININPLEAGNRYLYAQANKKRKAGTSIRSNASGSQQFRNKNRVVIYYDGDIQSQLTSLVKDIGIGRNNLRKGRNSLTVERGFRLPPLRAAQESPSVDNLRSTTTIMSGKKAVEPLVLKVTDPNEAGFLQVDKELESIQTLCETAAHQILRDGDCTIELDKILSKIEAVWQQAADTAASLKMLKQEQQEFSSDLGSPDAESAPVTPISPMYGHRHKSLNMDQGPRGFNTTLCDMRSRGAFLGTPAIAADSNVGLMADSIEVDDASDQDSVKLDLTQFGLGRARRTRI